MITQTSTTLLEDMRAPGNEAAWREFYRRYAPMILGMTRRLGLSEEEALDAVQETLLSVNHAFRNLDGPFDRSKGRFKAWLRGVVVHKVQDTRRRRHRNPVAMEADALTRALDGQCMRAGDGTDLEHSFEQEWQRNLLRLALDQLALEVEPQSIQALQLYAIEDQPVQKVAKLLGMSHNAVYLSKHKLLKRLKAKIDELRREDG